MMSVIHSGDRVQVRDAGGTWLDGIADSAIEPIYDGHRKIHDFPVIWVRLEGGDRIPWPAKDVRLADPA